MKRYLITLAALAFTYTPSFAQTASCDSCSVCQQKTCEVTVTQEEVDVTCFDVECEEICIPPVRFWWECGPLKSCGKIRTVKKLVTNKETKTVCVYKWGVKAICSDCYDQVYRLRCDEMGVDYGTPVDQLGMPTPVPVEVSSLNDPGYSQAKPPQQQTVVPVSATDSSTGMMEWNNTGSAGLVNASVEPLR